MSEQDLLAASLGHELSYDEEEIRPESGSGSPPVPGDLEETGLTGDFVSDLLLRTLYSLGSRRGADLEDDLCLPFSILDEQLLSLQHRRLLEVRGTKGHGRGGYVFDVTGAGRERARELMEGTGYVGPAPVTIESYWEWIRRQSIRNVRVTRADVVDGFRHLVLDEEFIETVGPAINSGRSVFLHGEAGNGKTAIAEAISRMFGDSVYIPHAILAEGKIIRIHDPVVHRSAREERDRAAREAGGTAAGDLTGGEEGEEWFRPPPSHDARFALVDRPVVVVGGELTLDQLELQFDPETGIFRAPPQLKANGGVFVIDDFGRQRVRPRDLLNRWMYPLERRMDFLGLPTGQKLPVPFDTLLVFATNLDPAELVEEAFLRRIRYKIRVDNPTREQYREIFQRMCGSLDIPFEERAVDYVYREYYELRGVGPRKCHPRDLLKHVADQARYGGEKPSLTEETLDRACRAYFLDTGASLESSTGA